MVIVDRQHKIIKCATLFVFISLYKCVVTLSCSSTRESAFSLSGNSLLHSADREDGIFKISLLRLKPVLSVYFVPYITCMWIPFACEFVWGGFHLLMSQKELGVDVVCNGLAVFIQSKCEGPRGKWGSAPVLGIARMALDRGPFRTARCFIYFT